MRRGYVGDTGAQTHYRRSDGSGRALALLHASPCSSAMWVALMEELETRGWAPVAFDLPGYGLSDPAGAAPSIADYAARIASALDALGIDRCPVIGQHTGVSVALQLASDRPALVESVVGIGVPYLDAAGAETLATEQAPVFDPDGAAVLSRWRLYWDRAHDRELRPGLAARTVSEWLGAGERSALAHRAVGRVDHARLLGALGVPMLALAGRHDVLAEQTRKAAEDFAGVEHHDLGEIGSFVADERPSELAAVIDRFLR